MTHIAITPMGDRICRTCGMADCPNIDGHIGYCPRWHDGPEPEPQTWDEHTAAAIEKILGA